MRQDFFIELLLGNRWVPTTGFPFSFGSFGGDEALVTFRSGFGGLAGVSAFGSRGRYCGPGGLDSLVVEGGSGDCPAGGAVLAGFVEQFGAA